MTVTFVFGSVHAFSVLILPLEARLGLPRADVSLVYSLALVAITTAVLLGHRVYAAMPAAALILLAGLGAGAGLLVAARAGAWWQLALGYSLMFGFCNGIAYGYCLQLAGAEMPRRRGFAMAAVTAAYAVGSIVFALLLGFVVRGAPVGAAFAMLAVAVLGGSLLAVLALRRADARFAAAPAAPDDAATAGEIWRFWVAYLGAVFAGLMAIGHAAAIVQALPGGGAYGTLGATLTGVGSAVGGFVAGALVDRWRLRWLLAGLPALSAVVLLLLAVGTSPVGAAGLLAAAGFGYGAIIAVYPVAIAHRFGADGPRVYGRVFTAWGFAGLVAPWAAGAIYDLASSYAAALVVAAAISAGSALLAVRWRFERVAEIGAD